MPDPAEPTPDLSGGAESRPSALARGVAAARANALPAVILQLIAVGVLLAYQHPTGRRAFESLQSLRDHVGWVYAPLSTWAAAALLPLLLGPLRRGPVPRTTLREVIGLTVFWCLKGVEVDALYRLQALIFGQEPGLALVVQKVLADQLVYVPLWAVPTTVWWYAAMRGRWRLGRTGLAWYREQVVPILILNWLVWIPAVAVIYCLPLALQLPIQNLILCLWALLLMFLTQPPGGSAPVDERRRTPRGSTPA